MLTGVYETLRSAGLELRLEAPGEPRLERAARGAARRARAGRRTPRRCAACELGRTAPEELLDLADLALAASDGFEEARARGRAGGARRARRRATASCCRSCCSPSTAAYREAKDRESALDFEDLQLLARDLLRDERRDPRARAAGASARSWSTSSRTRTGSSASSSTCSRSEDAELFFVGDEFQSIYRFRHADVEVFRERRAQVGGVLALTQNYRSRPEVLDVVNHLFGADFGDDVPAARGRRALPRPGLRAGRRAARDRQGRATRDTGVHWRQAEARHIARRVRELVDAGEATPGEIVLLFAAGTDAECYEEELRALGLPTYRATGRGYFGQQQVVDLLAYLRLLHNRYDDEALVARARLAVRRRLERRARAAAARRAEAAALRRAREGAARAASRERDARLFQAFRQRYDRLAALGAALSLERLCERIVAEHDYDLAVLAQWDGRRRYANLRKLARLARSYEELRGPGRRGLRPLRRASRRRSARPSSRRSPRRRARTWSGC